MKDMNSTIKGSKFVDAIQTAAFWRDKIQPISKPVFPTSYFHIGNMVYHRKRKCTIFAMAIYLD